MLKVKNDIMAHKLPHIDYSNTTDKAIVIKPVGFNRYSKVLNKSSSNVLPKAELNELVFAAQGGCQKSRDKAINACMRLSVAIAKRYVIYNKSKAIDLMDFIQAGNLGLIKAIDRFKNINDVSFATYAAFYIRAEIMVLFRDMHMIKLPVSPITASEWSETPGKRINGNAPIPVVSIYETVPNIDDSEEPVLYEDVIADPLNHVEYVTMLNSFRTDLKRATNSLHQNDCNHTDGWRQSRIFELYFLAEMQLEDIGGSMVISGERIRQIKDKAITRLRGKRSHMLADYPYYFALYGYRNEEMEWHEKEAFVEHLLGEATKPKPQLASLVCSVCDKPFSTPQSLEQHRRMTHEKPLPESLSPAKYSTDDYIKKVRKAEEAKARLETIEIQKRRITEKAGDKRAREERARAKQQAISVPPPEVNIAIFKKIISRSINKWAWIKSVDPTDIHLAIEMTDNPKTGDGEVCYHVLINGAPTPDNIDFTIDFLGRGNHDVDNIRDFKDWLLIYLMGQNAFVSNCEFQRLAAKYKIKKWSQLSVAFYLSDSELHAGVFIADDVGAAPSLKEQLSLFTEGVANCYNSLTKYIQHES